MDDDLDDLLDDILGDNEITQENHSISPEPFIFQKKSKTL
jgi:hypothetical protein